MKSRFRSKLRLLSFMVCRVVSDQVNVTVCVVRVLIRASHEKTKVFCYRKLCVRVCMPVHIHTIWLFCVDKLIQLWECVFCVRPLWQILRQFSALRDKGDLLQWLHSADRKSADEDCGWVCSWKSMFEFLLLVMCQYHTKWGQKQIYSSSPYSTGYY